MKTAKIIRKLSILLVALWSIFISAMPVCAIGIQPMFDSVTNTNTTLSITPTGQALCTVSATTIASSYRIEVTMSLNQINKSTPLKSWSLSENGGLSATKTYYVAKGHDYQVTATITVRDSGGRLIESFTTKSSIVHY